MKLKKYEVTEIMIYPLKVVLKTFCFLVCLLDRGCIINGSLFFVVDYMIFVFFGVKVRFDFGRFVDESFPIIVRG